MTQQTEAQRLADLIQRYRSPHCGEAAAELRRLDQHELANNVWHEKTEWVQNTAQSHELGMHRADVMRQRIKRLEAVNAQLLEALNGLLMCTPAYPAAPEGTAQARAHKSAIKAAFATIAAAKGEA
jgi:hypothetical protein